MAKSKMRQIAEEQLAKQTLNSKFNKNNAYDINHPAALSDGDEHGKGLYNGSVGSKTDIATRIKNLSKNPYNPSNEYKVED